jgi:hypothetical protein
MVSLVSRIRMPRFSLAKGRESAGTAVTAREIKVVDSQPKTVKNLDLPSLESEGT